MSGFQKKHSWFVLVKDFIFAKNVDTPEEIFKKIENRKKTLWGLFFYTYRRQILFVSILQMLLLSFILFFPFVMDFYLQFFTRSSSPIAQARLFSASVYLFAYISALTFVIAIKNKYLLNWKRTIKYHSWFLIGKLCEKSTKNSKDFIYKNFTDEHEKEIIDKCSEFPNIFVAFFSIPALIISSYFIYTVMGALFLIPLILLFSVFLFQFKNDLYLSKTFKKILELSQFRSQLLRRIFTYGNRVRILAMESFFLRKINLSQEYANKISKSVLQNLSLARVIYYFSGFIIAVPSILVYVLINKNSSFVSLTELVILFIFVAHFYANILNLFSNNSSWKKNFSQFQIKIELLDNKKEQNNKNDDLNEEYKVLLGESSVPDPQIGKLVFRKASFLSPTGLCLYNLSIDLKPGMLVAVVGQAGGSGKSAFISACAGELHLLSGETSFSNSFEVVPQNTYLFEGTLRENIILNREFEGRRYVEIIRSCALEDEMNALTDGDETWVDLLENNFSASFAKKVAIARALYGKSDYYYFDQPFHGLTHEDASQIFNEALQKQLAHASRVFVTQKLEFASLCNHIIVMKDGMIVEQGTHKSLVEKSGVYARLYYASADSRRFDFSQAYPVKRTHVAVSPLLDKENQYHEPNVNKQNEKRYFQSVFESLQYFIKFYFKDKRSFSSFTFSLLAQFSLCFAFFSLFSEYSRERFAYNWQVILFCLFSILSLVSFFFFHVKNAAINLILGSSLEKKVYDVLIKDHKQDLAYTVNYIEEFSQVKDKLFASFTSLLVRITLVIAGCFLLSITNISALFLLFALASFTTVFILIQKSKFYKTHLILNSELFKLSKFSKDFFGLFVLPNSVSLREFMLEKLKVKISHVQESARVKDNIIFAFNQFISLFFCLLVAISLVYFVVHYDAISAGTVTLVVLATVSFFQAFYNINEEIAVFLRCLPHFENLMRTSVKHEANEDLHYSTSEYWPQKGSLRIMSLSTMNSDRSPHFLKNLDLFVQHGGRLAIIEEIEHKKPSYFFATLLLFIPFETGTIFLDDEDILRVNPIELRSRFAYISLNSLFPFLSLRENLDPFEYFDDSEIWTVLNRVGMAQAVALLRNGLNSKIEELPTQLHWSGELVLFSLARALLHANKIILLDNLSVPEDIELRIIDLIEQEFCDATVLISTNNAKSSFLQLCQDVVRFENGEIIRVSIDKNIYHVPIPYEDIENAKTI